MNGMRAKQGDSLTAPGFCLACHHPESYHDASGCHAFTGIGLEYDCSCDALRLCAACQGDPEAHDLHVCGRP